MKKYHKQNCAAFAGALVSILISNAVAVWLQFFKGDVLDFAVAGQTAAGRWRSIKDRRQGEAVSFLQRMRVKNAPHPSRADARSTIPGPAGSFFTRNH